MSGYVCAALQTFQHEKPKQPQDSPHPWTQPICVDNNQMLNEKKIAEELDESNQKGIQKIVGKFLYYARSIDPKIIMALNSLAAVQTKPTIETAKQITQFLNFSASYPDAVTAYRRRGVILHIYLDVSHISEPEARSRAGGFFFPRPKIKQQHTNNSNAPRKWASTCGMQYHEKFHAIIH